MAPSGRDVTDAELAIMRVLWDAGPSTVRQLHERLYDGGGPSAHATVQKLLERLEAKAFVRRDRSGPVQRFEAVLVIEDLVDYRLRAFADQLCGGSLATLLSHLVDGRNVAAKDRKVLRDFLGQLDQESRRDEKKS